MRLPSTRSVAAFLRAVAMLARSEVLFRVGGSGRVTAESTRRMRGEAEACEAELRLEEILIIRAGLRRAKRIWPLPVHCLQSSIALHSLLEHQSIGAHLLIGVRMEESDLKSHAWVQVGDYVVDDAHPVHDFSVIDPSDQTPLGPGAAR